MLIKDLILQFTLDADCRRLKELLKRYVRQGNQFLCFREYAPVSYTHLLIMDILPFCTISIIAFSFHSVESLLVEFNNKIVIFRK